MIGAGIVPLADAFAVTLGANVGTTVTAILASLAVAASSAWASPEESFYGLLIVGAGVPAYFLVRRLFASSGEGA